MPGTFTERQEGQCRWHEVGKGAGRLDAVNGAAGDKVCRIWQPTVRTLTFTLSEIGTTEDLEPQRKEMKGFRGFP